MQDSTYNTVNSALHDEALKIPVAATPDRLQRPMRRRVMLILGSSALLIAPLLMFEPAAHWADEADLFILLRGMACIKGLLAVIAFTTVWWRLRQTPTSRLAQTYIGGVWAMALATGLIWQLTFIVAASALFHCATIALLIAAWRDGGLRLQQQLPSAASVSLPKPQQQSNPQWQQ